MAGPALAPIIVPPISALGGLIVGRLWDVLGETRRWRRDQCAKAYADFVGSADALLVEVSREAKYMDHGRASESLLRMTQTGAMVDVFGAPDAAEIAHRLWNQASEWLSDWDHLVTEDGAEWESGVNGYRALLLAMTNSVRVHLGDKGKIALSAAASPAGAAAKPIS